MKMTTGTHSITMADGHRIELLRREPQASATPVAVVQLLHGLREHVGRYERFAAACEVHGFAVVGHDHRGHGTNCDSGTPGHFADRGGWDRVVEDAMAVQAFARRAWPGVPVVLFGHSMGSFIAQAVVARAPDRFAALALSGSTWPSRARVRAGRWLAGLSLLVRGGRSSSAFLDRLGVGNLNRRFAPVRTDADWLSRDEAEVDRFVADPRCRIPLSVRLWHDFLGGLLEVTSTRALRRIPAALPILITGGGDDALGGRRGMTRLAEAYRRTGHTNVSLEIWPDGRHEMLNEIDREEFTRRLLAWFEGKREPSQSPASTP